MKSMKEDSIEGPRDIDVMCGRGGGTNHHTGNRTYREHVNKQKLLYSICTKNEKQAIIRQIVSDIRRSSGRFLQYDDGEGKWYDVGDKKARTKTSQALREGQPKLKRQKHSSSSDQCAPSARDNLRKPPSPPIISHHTHSPLSDRRAESADDDSREPSSPLINSQNVTLQPPSRGGYADLWTELMDDDFSMFSGDITTFLENISTEEGYIDDATTVSLVSGQQSISFQPAPPGSTCDWGEMPDDISFSLVRDEETPDDLSIVSLISD